MTLLRMDNLSLEFGDQVILRNANFSIELGERVGLVGRNGAGKTTLLRLINREQQADEGEIEYRADLRISQLSQALPSEHHLETWEFVTKGLNELQMMVDEYQRRARANPTSNDLRELEALQLRIDGLDGWRIPQRVDTVISELGLPRHQKLSDLSGGWQRRVALAQALVSDPELLLLDEPTNHLDLATIEWLEQRLRGYSGGLVFVTHDRAFLQKLATRIVELDRGELISWPGSYHHFLRRKAAALSAEQRYNREFDKKLANEEAWIRQGIKARRTRNEGRVRALETMRSEREARIDRPRSARINIDEAQASGRKVIRARNVSYGYDENILIEDFSLQIMRGDRIGLIGNNGVGKSTLLRLLIGRLKPQTGTIKLGTQLEIGFFDPLVDDLDPEKSVAENVGEGRDYVQLNGKDVHVVGYLRGFLFSAKRTTMPVKALSGGEKNRVRLAKLFTRPSNLLIMDEPSNDLDVETLEALEKRLREYQGTLIVTSHDREFLENVVTSVLVFEADRQVHHYVGGYADWARRGLQLAEREQLELAKTDNSAAKKTREKRRQKLSYKEQRELDQLPGNIEYLEAEIESLHKTIANPDFYAGESTDVQDVLQKLETKSAALEALVERWASLEELRLDYQSKNPNL